MVTVLYLQRAPLFTFGVCRPRVMLSPQLVSKVVKALIEKLKGVAMSSLVATQCLTMFLSHSFPRQTRLLMHSCYAELAVLC